MVAIFQAVLVAAAAAIPISMYSFETTRVSPSDDGPTRWDRFKKLLGVVATLALVVFFLYDIDVTTLTFSEIAILVAAMAVPTILFIIGSQIRDVRWGYLVQAIIVMSLPGLVILTVHDVLPNVVAALFGGILFTHITTYLDTD